MPERISAEAVRQAKKAGKDVTLVCAYDDEQKCQSTGVDGALTLKEFQARVSSFPKNKELVFFCA